MICCRLLFSLYASIYVFKDCNFYLVGVFLNIMRLTSTTIILCCCFYVDSCRWSFLWDDVHLIINTLTGIFFKDIAALHFVHYLYAIMCRINAVWSQSINIFCLLYYGLVCWIFFSLYGLNARTFLWDYCR